MYTEQLRMSPTLTALLAAPFVFVLAVLAGLLLFVPVPIAGRLPIYGAMLLQAAVGVLLLAMLSQIRIVITEQTLTIAFRILFAKHIALTRIASCAPTDAAVWGISYRYRGTSYRTRSGGERAVLLRLTNGAQVVFASRHAVAVCAALRAHRPAIVAA